MMLKPNRIVKMMIPAIASNAETRGTLGRNAEKCRILRGNTRNLRITEIRQLLRRAGNLFIIFCNILRCFWFISASFCEPYRRYGVLSGLRQVYQN